MKDLMRHKYRLHNQQLFDTYITVDKHLRIAEKNFVLQKPDGSKVPTRHQSTLYYVRIRYSVPRIVFVSDKKKHVFNSLKRKQMQRFKYPLIWRHVKWWISTGVCRGVSEYKQQKTHKIFRNVDVYFVADTMSYSRRLEPLTTPQ
jgi:hypothetical protein